MYAWRIIALIAVFCALGMISPARCNAQDIVTVKGMNPRGCKAPQRLSYAAALERGSALPGKCVEIDGVWKRGDFFANTEDANRTFPDVDVARTRILGTYMSDEVYRALPNTEAAVRVVGLFGLCDDLVRSLGPDAFIGGWCHGGKHGAYIIVASARRLPPGP